MRLRTERALLALAIAAAVAQVACSDKQDETTAPVTTATMHSPEADAANKAPEEEQPQSALATLSVASASSVSGDLRLEQRADGVWISGEVSGLSPGDHAIQFHEKGDCNAPDASSAGDPFVPEQQPGATSASTTPTNAAPAGEPQPGAMPETAGTTPETAPQPNAAPAAEPQPGATPANAPQPNAAPAGDVRQAANLGTIQADESGEATVALLAKDVTLAGDNAVLERSVLIYDVPAADTGDQLASVAEPVACGVIRSTASAVSQRPEQEQDSSFSMRSESERGSGATESEGT